MGTRRYQLVPSIVISVLEAQGSLVVAAQDDSIVV